LLVSSGVPKCPEKDNVLAPTLNKSVKARYRAKALTGEKRSA
jgi:hypothetical protein